jgi:thiol:disulfide interchange protein DsbC
MDSWAKRNSSIGVGFVIALFAGSASGAATDIGEIAAVKKALASAYPQLVVSDVRPSPLPGLYQVTAQDNVFYVDKTGDYLIGGPLVATRTKTDLTQKVIDDRDAIEFDRLPLDKAIKTTRGNGEHVVAVFADPDCPYCHNLEKELAGLGDVTIYTFLFPLTDLHPDARNKAHAIWCAPDRSAAWHDWMILDQGPPPPGPQCAHDPLDDLQMLGASFKISSTPVIFLENGHRIRGTLPSAQLNAKMVTAHTEKPQAANSGGKAAPKS